MSCHILSAKDLINADLWGKSDPYVKVRFNHRMLKKRELEDKEGKSEKYENNTEKEEKQS